MNYQGPQKNRNKYRILHTYLKGIKSCPHFKILQLVPNSEYENIYCTRVQRYYSYKNCIYFFKFENFTVINHGFQILNINKYNMYKTKVCTISNENKLLKDFLISLSLIIYINIFKICIYYFITLIRICNTPVFKRFCKGNSYEIYKKLKSNKLKIFKYI